MKNPERVAALIAELRTLAETPLEVATIDRCEKDLQEPPQIEIVGDDTQIFDGITFHKLPSGYYQGQVRMHRYVWKRFYGEFSGDYVVHHKDRNPENNDIANLQALSTEDHSSCHNQDRQNARIKTEFVCDCCGKTFFAFSNGANRYCSKACRKKYRQHGDDYQRETVCVVCGKKFTVRKDKRTKTCSTACLSELRRRNNIVVPQTETRTCVICGKQYITRKDSTGKTCSTMCSHELQWRTRKNQVVNSEESNDGLN